jgi:protein-disulfide isomerase
MSKRDVIRERRRQEQARNRRIAIAIVAAGVILIAAALLWQNFKPLGEIAQPSSGDYAFADGTALGDPDAPVLIEEYSDFQCPYCRIFHEETLPLIIEEYVETGKVRFVFRHYTIIGRESADAANASLCAAEENRFWEYADIVYANQSGENSGDLSERRLLAFAETLGLNTDEFSACLNETRYEDTVLEDLSAALNVGFDSTPSFIINGKALIGAQPFSVFQQAIEAELAASGS